jgi:hypothetical protein
MSTFIELTIFGGNTKIYVNMDHVTQMYRTQNSEERRYTRLIYTEYAEEDVLTDQVTEPPIEILTRITESRLRAR